MYAENTKKIRNYLRLSVNEMADIVGMPARTLGGYERRERTPSIEFVTQLCKKLDVNANWFLTGEGEMFNPPKFEQARNELAQRMERMEAALKSAGLLKD